MDVTPRHRRALSAVLAVFLAVESVSAVAAAAQTSLQQRAAASQAAAAPAANAGPTGAATAPAAPVAGPPFVIVVHPDRVLDRPTVPVPAAPKPAPKKPAKTRPAADVQAPRVTHHSSTKSTTKSTHKSSSTKTSSTSFRGRNHVWIPSLGINRTVYSFPCSRTRPPDNYVYRWGCAGTNNVYLLGHAWGVFKPLHDAYVNHRLRVGMTAYYADGSGRVHGYKVIWWKLTRPTTAASWAWASLSKPSMTLQTCVGAQSQYRLMVRLVRFK
jgi:hypothetical protein